MRIAVLALQGAFIEHEQMLHSLGVETFQVRQLSSAIRHQTSDIVAFGGPDAAHPSCHPR